MPAPEATAFDLRFTDAAALVESWQAWAPDAPDELAASLVITAGPDPDEPPDVKVFGAMLGSRAETEEPMRHWLQTEWDVAAWSESTIEHAIRGTVKECIEQLGGDPTTQTPCADVTGVASMGLLQVVTDPKTNVNQSLHALLVAELADGAAWEELVVLARELGQEEMAKRFEEAGRHEAEHLETVKQWHLEATLQEARTRAH